jgi:holliday junction DNA helicase RuvB
MRQKSKKNEVFSPIAQSGDEQGDHWNLRPQCMDECIGQQQVLESLRIAIQAAKGRNEPLDHILLFGPPGLGKTTFARIIANEMGTRFQGTSGPALEKAGDIVALLTNLEEGEILFIDEIHRLSKTVEEFLYPAMEDFRVDIIFDKGANARVYRPTISRFTLIGATTRAGLVSSPLRQRFGLTKELSFYSTSDLLQAVKRSARILDVEVDEEGAREIAKRSRGTMRIANQLLRRVRDYAQVKGNGRITQDLADQALHIEGVDDIGLTDLDRRLLSTIIERYAGGPVGIEAIAASLQEEARTLEDMVEPYLLNIGFLVRTTGGRKATELACQHLNLKSAVNTRLL